MSQGLVPVSFPVGVAPEIIRNGENGFLVKELAEAEEKVKLLFRRSHLRRRMSKLAMETAEQFRSEKLINKTLALYNKILNK